VGASGSNKATTIYSTSGIIAGMTAVGPYIPGGTTVSSVSNGVITLSANFTADFDDYITFTPANTAKLYVAPIALGTSTLLDPYTWKFMFASAQASPPFSLGNNITVAGVTPSDYNGTYSPIGVVECTTTYVIARTSSAYSVSGPGSGGTVTNYNTSQTPDVYALSTDCNSKVNVTGGTDRVFVSAQLNNVISYTATTSSDLWYTVAINRYAGFPNTDPVNPGYYFINPQRISIKTYKYAGLTGTGVLDEVQTIFSSFADSNIDPGYYWYIMDVSFQVQNGGNLQVTQSKLNLRSMTTQVVKQ
jgi:hypothetical protein